MVQPLFIFLQFIFLSLISKTNGFTLKMIPIDSPNLQIVPQHFTALERHQFLANISMSRVNSYPINSSRVGPNTFKAPLILAESSFYVTKLAFGTSEGLLSPILLLDTAYSETWVQCEGCNPCMEFSGNNFSYTASPTFKRMGIDDPMCNRQLSYKGSCRFEITYDGGLRAIGFVGRDNFYFENAKTGHIDMYPGLAFGCGLDIEGFNKLGEHGGPDNHIAGIHGLAPGPRSFLTQLNAQIKGRFSYCLAPWSPGGGLSEMYFGDDAQISGDNTRIVQTISMHNVLRYHLYLNGISVDGTRVAIDPSIFELDPITYSKGFFIDSGSPYTYLARSAFDPLKDAVAKYFDDKYSWQPMPHVYMFELCYAIHPNDDHVFPSVIFHFQMNGQGEIDWVMDNNNMFELLGNEQGFCTTILKVDDPGPHTFGAYQQVNFRILYDVANGLLSFVPHNCLEVTF